MAGTDKLEAFVRATSFRAPGVDPRQVTGVLSLALVARGAGELAESEDGRVLVKLAALGIAFVQELDSIVRGDFELDHREEAILDAVVEYLEKEAAS
jgi:hypothetical protein